ncbi:hypothetical protein TSUD_143520 [Trifolium subterraneum]|uniref:Transmembrane protein n=1 Tax=Trifolium subterraneum TaxID=3900 RepID=A0A2Z6NBE2_TRISU|nr:hypothetical protein TSUD_143520 [Trifolium subterraneum]
MEMEGKYVSTFETRFVLFDLNVEFVFGSEFFFFFAVVSAISVSIWDSNLIFDFDDDDDVWRVDSVFEFVFDPGL